MIEFIAIHIEIQKVLREFCRIKYIILIYLERVNEMNFKVNKTVFSKAISEVSRSVSLKATIPIMSGIKIIVKLDSLILIGGNSDFVIEKLIPQKIDEVNVLEVYSPGSAVVSAKYLNELVKKLPSDIKLELNDNYLITIQSEEIVTTLNTFNTEEYPSLPNVEKINNVRILNENLIKKIKQTVFAVSKKETRPVLTGVNFTINEDGLTCVATDSHRLALSTESTVNSNINKSIVVPGVSLSELIKLFSSESTMIDIYTTDNYILFKSKTLSLYSRLIDGNYPDTSRLISQEAKTIIKLKTKQLLNGVDRARLFSSEWENNNIDFHINETKLKISSKSTQVGKINETQKIVKLIGEKNLKVTLDGTYIVEALRGIEEEEVSLNFGKTMQPIIIKPIGDNSQIYLISPVRSF